MSQADKQFIKLCTDILNNGTSTMNQKVRPHWEDGESAYTIKQFGVVNKYDLRKEFPAITLRRTAIKSAVDEILWIYQKKSNNINDLNSHIWDQWADEKGSIGKAYGYQVAKDFIHHKEHLPNVTIEDILSHPDVYPDFMLARAVRMYHKTGLMKTIMIDNSNDIYFVNLDQMDGVLYDLKHTPFSRRIMISLWNVEDLHEMNLQPCCWSVNFNVTDEGGDKLVLNMVLNQRSSDVLTANNWNVVQYAVLLMMVAQVSDMIPGQLVHVMTDAHIYDRHIPIVKKLINQPIYDAPKVHLNPDVKNFYNFTIDDVIVENYSFSQFTDTIPVAI